MKYLLLLLLAGCATSTKSELVECLIQQEELYGDLCAESSSGYEDMTGNEAHYEGVKCAVESSIICLEDRE